MKEIKLLEIGADGGGLAFYMTTKGSKSHYFIGSNRDEKYKTLCDMLISYKINHDPLLWYYPVEVNPEFRDKILPILLSEYQNHPTGHFMNLETWEEMLDLQFEKLSNGGYQTFRITPVQKTETYSYNHFGDERVMDSVTTEYSNKPAQKQIVMGVGTIEDNAFVIRDRDWVLLGVFPLERYEVDVINE
jgi:hypothetical protein